VGDSADCGTGVGSGVINTVPIRSKVEVKSFKIEKWAFEWLWKRSSLRASKQKKQLCSESKYMGNFKNQKEQ